MSELCPVLRAATKITVSQANTAARFPFTVRPPWPVRGNSYRHFSNVSFTFARNQSAEAPSKIRWSKTNER